MIVLDASIAVLEGSFSIENSLDAAMAASFETITGDLIIDAPGLTSVRLPRLREVGGQLRADSLLPLLELPALIKVQHHSDVRLVAAGDLSSLQEVGGSLATSSRLANFPALTAIGQTLDL